jgi:aspartate 1-decarboxylase
VLGINGAAAHLIQPGDIVILLSYGVMDELEARASRPKVIFVGSDNRIVEQGSAPGYAPGGSGLLDASATASGDADAVAPAAETVDAARLDALIQAES